MPDETSEVNKTAAEVKETPNTFRDKVIGKARPFAIVICIALFIAIVIAVISEQNEASKLEGWNKILKATFTAQTTDGDMTKEVSEALKGNEGTPSAMYGEMLVIGSAGISYDKAKLETAKKAGQEFIKNNSSHPFLNQVKLDYGTILFNLEDYQGALTSYNEVIASKTSYLEGEATFFKALALEKLGKDEEAIKTYTSIVSNEELISAEIRENAEFAKAQLEEKTKN